MIELVPIRKRALQSRFLWLICAAGTVVSRDIEGGDCCRSSFPGHRLGVFARAEVRADDRRLTPTISGGENWEKGLMARQTLHAGAGSSNEVATSKSKCPLSVSLLIVTLYAVLLFSFCFLFVLF